MKDRVPLYPGRVKLNPVSGQPNTYDMVRADEPTQEGTPLNKATLLKDATAALYGLPNTAVPDDVFLSISNYANFYVWEKTKRTSEYIEKRTRSGSGEYIRSGMYDTHTYNYSSSISIDQSSGSVSLVNPQSMQKQNYNQNDIADAIRGKYFTINDGVHNGIYLCITVAGNTDNSVYCSAYDTITSELVIDVQSFGYVLTPTNDSPVEEGYIFVAFGQLGNKVIIETGSYVGTGTYGSSNPNSLTFDFEPKIVFLYMGYNELLGSNTMSFFTSVQSYYSNNMIFPEALTTTYKENMGFALMNGTSYGKKSSDGKKIFWYHTHSAIEQHNKSGEVYRYIAIG